MARALSPVRAASSSWVDQGHGHGASNEIWSHPPAVGVQEGPQQRLAPAKRAEEQRRQLTVRIAAQGVTQSMIPPRWPARRKMWSACRSKWTTARSPTGGASVPSQKFVGRNRQCRRRCHLPTADPDVRFGLVLCVRRGTVSIRRSDAVA